MCLCDRCIPENRRTGRRIVCGFGLLTFLSAGALIYFSLMFRDQETINKVELYITHMNNLNKYDLRRYLFTSLMTMSGFTILAGLFAMIFKWMRNKCCTVIFGCLMLPLWLYVLVLGLITLYVAIITEDAFVEECDNLLAANKG